MFSHIDLTSFIIFIAVLIIAITVHEFSHAIVADMLGDPTPRMQKRISLNPLNHLDPLGTIMMVITSLTGFGFGWGKPVMTNPYNFKNPKRDQSIVALAGPVSNLIQATIFAMIFRPIFQVNANAGPLETFLFVGIHINLFLAFFNLIPISPLDGHWIMIALLPRKSSMVYERWMNSWGPFVFLLIVFLAPGLLSQVLGPPVNFCIHLLVPQLG